MKILLDLPEWCDERDIVILAGIELAAYKKATEDKFKVKQIRCNLCGECCKGFKTESGYCEHIIFDGDHKICELGSDRSYACCIGEHVMNVCDSSVCCIRYNEV
jgi:hypothetical protein